MIGFMNHNLKEQLPIVKETFTNAICYGQTGSGKTTGFLLPNIKNRMKLNHGLLIYDFKGNLHEQVKYIAQQQNKLDDVYEIGKPWGETIDILKYASSKSLQSLFDSISDNDKSRDTYWANSAYTIFENIFFLLKDLKLITSMIYKIDNDIIKYDYDESQTIYNPILKNIFNIVKSSKSLVYFFSEIELKIKAIKDIVDAVIVTYLKDDIKDKLNQILKLQQDITQYYENLSEYHTLDTKGESVGGKNGVLQVLNQILLSVSTQEFFNDDKFDIVQNLQQGKIIIINLSQFNTKMMNFLNLSIYTRLIEQTALSNIKQPITIFIDEAQKVLNEHSIPDVDICRENKFEFLLSTQDIALLVKQIGDLNSYLLLRNITTQFSFKTIDGSDKVTKLKEFEYVDLLNNKQYKTKPIFIDTKDLALSEYHYQKKVDAFRFVNTKAKYKFILKYSPSLVLENKLISYHIAKNKSETIDIYYGTKFIDDYIKNKIDILSPKLIKIRTDKKIKSAKKRARQTDDEFTPIQKLQIKIAQIELDMNKLFKENNYLNHQVVKLNTKLLDDSVDPKEVADTLYPLESEIPF